MKEIGKTNLLSLNHCFYSILCLSFNLFYLHPFSKFLEQNIELVIYIYILSKFSFIIIIDRRNLSTHFNPWFMYKKLHKYR